MVQSVRDSSSGTAAETFDGRTLIAASPSMVNLVREAKKAARSDAPVLLNGETGTGKELIARLLHAHSTRHRGPFVAVNCGAIPKGLLQSELFGYERGAFTGATRRNIGRIESAAGGTLFLDEVADLDPDGQVSLLRFLQEHTIERLGSSGSRMVDTRIIAASHVDLQVAVGEQRFREDLFFRLSVIPLQVPPLRERVDDITPLADHYLEDFSLRSGRLIHGFSRQATQAMLAHAWPGNIRELTNRIWRAVAMFEGHGSVSARELGFEEDGERITVTASPLGNRLLSAEREALEIAMRRSPNNMSRVAQHLGISRRSLYRLLAKHGGRDSLTRRFMLGADLNNS